MPPLLRQEHEWYHNLAWITLVLGAGVALELLGVWLGILLPGVVLTAFYLGVAGDWRRVLPLALIVGTMLEVWLDRRTVLPLVLPAVAWLAQQYRLRGDRDHPLLQAPAGFALGVGYGLPLLLLNNFGGGAFLLSAARVAWLLPGTVVVATLGLPLVVWAADAVARLCGLPCFGRDAEGLYR